MAQTIPYGPTTPIYPSFFQPTCSYEFTIPASVDAAVSTIFNCGYAMRLKTQGNATFPVTVYVQHGGDSAMVKYVLSAGESISGPILKIGSTATGTTAATVVLEV